MRYYSETLKKFYDTEKDCIAAEKEYAVAKAKEDEELKKKAEEKKIRAAEVEEAFKRVVAARKEADALYNEYLQKRSKFIKDYGYYHQSFKDEEAGVISIFDAFSDFFKIKL